MLYYKIKDVFLIKQELDTNQKNNKIFTKFSFLSHKNTILLSLHVFIVGEKGMAHQHVILRKIPTISK